MLTIEGGRGLTWRGVEEEKEKGKGALSGKTETGRAREACFLLIFLKIIFIHLQREKSRVRALATGTKDDTTNAPFFLLAWWC